MLAGQNNLMLEFWRMVAPGALRWSALHSVHLSSWWTLSSRFRPEVSRCLHRTHTLGLTGSAQGSGAQYNVSLLTGDGSESDYLLRNLRLSANALLNVELSYSWSASASNAPTCHVNDVCVRSSSINSERANASVGLSLSYNYLDDGMYVGYSKLVGDSVHATASAGIQAGAYVFDDSTGDLQLVTDDVPGSDQTNHADGVLKVSFFNASQSDQLAKLRIGMTVWGAGTTQAVPEPSSFGLFALGAAALYARSRRARKC